MQPKKTIIPPITEEERKSLMNFCNESTNITSHDTTICNHCGSVVTLDKFYDVDFTIYGICPCCGRYVDIDGYEDITKY
jgi:hypothetical protein